MRRSCKIKSPIRYLAELQLNHFASREIARISLFLDLLRFSPSCTIFSDNLATAGDFLTVAQLAQLSVAASSPSVLPISSLRSIFSIPNSRAKCAPPPLNRELKDKLLVGAVDDGDNISVVLRCVIR